MKILLFALLLSAGDDIPLQPVDQTRFIQLGAERTEAQAAQSWEDVRTRTGTLLDSLEPRISPVEVKHEGRLYRLRAGPVDARDAASICAQLKARAIDCMVVH